MSDGEVDIYGDLPEFNYDDNLLELQTTIDELLARNDELYSCMAQTRSEKEKTEEKYNLIKKNMSSFILTAQKEVARKDKTINELRKQISELEKAKYNKSGRISSHERNGRQYSSSAEGERRKYGRRPTDLTRRQEESDENNIPDQRSNKEVISPKNENNGFLPNKNGLIEHRKANENGVKKLIPMKNNKNVQNHMTVFSERMRKRIEAEKEKEKEEAKTESLPILEKEASKIDKEKSPEVTKVPLKAPQENRAREATPKISTQKDSSTSAENRAREATPKISTEKDSSKASGENHQKINAVEVSVKKATDSSLKIKGATSPKILRSHTLRSRGTASPFSRITRKRSSIYNPISSNWNVKNGTKTVSTPPVKKIKNDLSPSDLFGSDCSISDDDDVPDLKLPPAVYEDSCSAQICNSLFGKTDGDKLPFQTLPKSIFSPLKNESSKPNPKIIEDSFIGQFETTTQFVSALTKVEAKISPLRSSKSSDDVTQILANKDQSLFQQVTGSNIKVNVLIPRKHPRVYSKPPENKPNKSFSLKESFIFEQEEKVKNLNTENDKIIPVSPRKRTIQKLDWVLQPLEPTPRTTVRRQSLNLDGKDSKGQTLQNRDSTERIAINGNQELPSNKPDLKSQAQCLDHKIEDPTLNRIISKSASRSSPLNHKSEHLSACNSKSNIAPVTLSDDATQVQSSTPIIKVIKKRRKATLVNVDDPGKFTITRHRPINFSNTD